MEIRLKHTSSLAGPLHKPQYSRRRLCFGSLCFGGGGKVYAFVVYVFLFFEYRVLGSNIFYLLFSYYVLWVYIYALESPSMKFPSLWMEAGCSDAKNIIPVTLHPCHTRLWADGSLSERTGRFRRFDPGSPNERAELWPKT